MKSSAVWLFPLTLVLSACGSDKSSNSMDQEGNCSSSFVSDYNSVVNESKRLQGMGSIYSEQQKLSQLRTLNNACDQFLGHHSGASCTAEVQYQAKQVSSSDHVASCSKVKELLAGLEAPSTIHQTNDSTLFTSLKANQIGLKILDEATVIKSLKDPNLVMVNGKVGTLDQFKTEVINGAVFCFFSSTQPGEVITSAQNGETVSAVSKTENIQASNRRVIVISFGDAKGMLMMGCMKTSIDPFTVEEVRSSIKGIADLKVKIAVE